MQPPRVQRNRRPEGTKLLSSIRAYSFNQLFPYLPFAVYPLPSLSMRRAIYPGSFDPVTNGHLDIIERGCKLFDEIIIAILMNPDKQPFFSIEERRDMLEQVLQTIEQRNCVLRVDDFEGLLVHYALAQKAHAIVRGIRAISDYEYELQMALMNRRLEPSIETVFMMPEIGRASCRERVYVLV